MERWSGCVLGVLIAIPLMAFIGWLMALAIQWGWNTLLTPLFGLPPLDFNQAFAAFILLSVLSSFLRPKVPDR